MFMVKRTFINTFPENRFKTWDLRTKMRIFRGFSSTYSMDAPFRKWTPSLGYPYGMMGVMTPQTICGSWAQKYGGWPWISAQKLNKNATTNGKKSATQPRKLLNLPILLLASLLPKAPLGLLRGVLDLQQTRIFFVKQNKIVLLR